MSGEVRSYRGQRYRPIGEHDHVKADGSQVRVADWETECAQCGITFRLFTTAKWEPNRRCGACKAPGKRV